MALRIVGQHKGSVEIDLETATVLELKQAVSRASGLGVSTLKLLAGGRHLKDDTATLAQYGIALGHKVIVLRQTAPPEVQAEASLHRRTEEVAQAASALSARAARDIGRGGRGNLWGERGQGRGSGGRGQGGAAVNNRPAIELTNQDGQAMAIPQEDSAALMEGIMLHKRGLACLKRLSKPPSNPASNPPPDPAASSLAAVNSSAHTAHKSDEPRVAPQGEVSQDPLNPNLVPDTTHVPSAASTGKTLAKVSLQSSNVSAQRGKGWEEQKVSEAVGCSSRGETKAGGGGLIADEGSSHKAQGGQTVHRDAAAAGTTMAENERKGGEDGAGDASREGGVKRCSEEGAGVTDTTSGVSDKKAKGKATPGQSPVPPGRAAGYIHAPSAAEKRLAQREALGLLMRADEAFRRCNPTYLEMVDNYAYLCLDVVWLLFLMKDMSNLDLATRMLGSVERGFRAAHGEGLQRLTALKGEYCAEKLLYVRLHLLQGVVAFLRGDSGKASGLLIRASEEAKTLRPNPALAARLMRQWRAVKFETLKHKVALRALRAGRNDLDAAWQYLEGLRQRQDLAKKERKRRVEQRKAERFGLTKDKKGFVAAALVDQLAAGGFSRGKAVRALREHNNDVGAALASLTSASSSSNTATGDTGESLAILQSLGVAPDAAFEVLERTGKLCDALNELGIEVPHGVDVAGVTGGGGRGRRRRGADGAGVAAGQGSDGADAEDEDSDDGDSDDDSEGDSDDDEEEEEEVAGPTEEEMKLFDDLAGDRANDDEEEYLDVSLEDEADAADMYLHLCKGNIPVTFDLEKLRAGMAKAATTDTARP